MKLPFKPKKLNFKKGSERGSVTLFVLIAMLFFLAIGIMIFIINMNTGTSQKRDVEKIKSEYSSSTDDTDLKQVYEQAKEKQYGKFVIKVLDSYKESYSSGEWINNDHRDRLALTVDAAWPAGVANIEIIDHNGDGIRIHNKEALNNVKFDVEGKYQIKGKLDGNVETIINVNIDLTAPTTPVIAPNGKTIWRTADDEEISQSEAITITSDDVYNAIGYSGLKEIQYIIDSSPNAPAENAEWKVYNSTAKPVIDNNYAVGTYYVHTRAIDVAGNISDVATSNPYVVRNTHYKVTTASGIQYAEFLKDAVSVPNAITVKVISNDYTDTEEATINQNITIDTNGKTLTMAETITVASGKTATFVDTAATKGLLKRTTGDLITSDGTVKVGSNSTDGATLLSKNNTLKGEKIIVNSGSVINEGTINAAINGNDIEINGGNISSTGNYGVLVYSGGKCDVKGGRIEAVNGICPQTGTLTISGDAVIRARDYAIKSDATWHRFTLVMNGGELISTNGKAIYTAVGTSNVNITITGGTITGYDDGISITGANNTLTIGNNQNALDRTSPVITGTSGYSVNMTGADSIFNFYDGKLVGGTKGERKIDGREMSFNIGDGVTFNPYPGHRPYTRENSETHKFETVLEKQVKVTFNPNPNGNEGATVAEEKRNVLTNVEYKEKAETAEKVNLPTPTRTGYTFKGWNGKNLFDKNNTENVLSRAYLGEGIIHSYAGNDREVVYIPCKGNTTYTVSKERGLENDRLSIAYIKDEPNIDVEIYGLRNIPNIYGTVGEKVSITTTTSEDAKYIVIWPYWSSDVSSLDSVQLEEGSAATAYEPYYVTDDTKVTQEVDHTLTAIWKAHEYNVHFDKNDSNERPAVGTVADQHFVYDQAQNLNANEFVRIGYVFNGWNTKADGTGTPYADKASVSNLTAEDNGSVTLYAQWIEANATFREGYAFNIAAKKLAGNLEATVDSDNTNITQIKYATIGDGTDQITLAKLKEIKQNAVNYVSTVTAQTKYVKVSDDTQSNTSIYIWYESGKLYWFSEDDTPYMNADSGQMFKKLKNLEIIPELNKIDTSKVTTMQSLFNDCQSLTSLDLSNFNTSNVTNMSYMFYICKALTSLNVSGFDTSEVTSMEGMFQGSSRLGTIDVSGFDTSKVTNFNSMFQNCSGLTSITINRPAETTTSATMLNMFNGCSGLTSLNLSGLHTQKVTSMYYMFAGCSSITTLDVSGFNTSNVTTMDGMFSNCSSLITLDMSGFNTNSVQYMGGMFQGCNSITQLDLRCFNTSNVEQMHLMFNNCNSLTTIYATNSFTTENVTSSSNMFYNCSVLKGGSGTPYSADHQSADYAWIDGAIDPTTHQARPGYFTNHYYIEYNPCGGTGTMSRQGIPFSNATALSANGFTRSGYIFRGWAKSENGAVVFGDGHEMNYDLNGIKAEVITAADKADDKNVTLRLYAVWAQVHYTVTYGSPATTKPAETLAEAVSIAEAGIDGTTVTTATITAMNDYTDNSVTDTNNAGNGVVISKNIVIDLAGHTITRDKTITNNATLDIYSSADGGTITGALDTLITNNGTLTTNGTSADHTLSLISNEGRGITIQEGAVNGRIIINNKTTITTKDFALYNLGSTKKGDTPAIEVNGADTIISSTGGRAIQNECAGTVLINNGTLSSNESATIRNNAEGTITVKNGTLLSSANCGIYNVTNGTVNFEGGSILGVGGIYNEANGTIKVSGASTTITATGSSGQGIRGYTGRVTVQDATINAGYSGVSVESKNGLAGVATISSGNITGTKYGLAVGGNATMNVEGGSITGAEGIYNNANGTINVSGNNTSITATGASGNGIRGYVGTVNVSGGNITAKYCGISVQTKSNVSGTAKITGGTITSGQYGVAAAGYATVTLGENEGGVPSKETPKIISTAASGNYYGVTNYDTATFNFYDGKIMGLDGKSIMLQESDKPDGYQVVKRTANGRETAVLEKEVTVTFEPNPGETTGATVSEENRKVLTNVEYQYDAAAGTNRTLPTPEKTGYTFKGWQPADNLISTNPSDWQQGGLMDATGVENANNKRIRTDYIRVSPNTKYKLSVNNSNNIIRRYILYYNEEKAFIGRNEEYVSNVEEFTTPSNCHYIRTVLQYGYAGTTDITPSNVTDANIYLTETVTDSTLVTQENNHTLNAIWEANPYTVHFDGDGATGGTMADQTFKYDEEKALTQNAFTRTHTVTYDGNEGTSAKASDTATYTFANWGNKDILGYDIDMSNGKTDGNNATYEKYNGYTVGKGSGSNGNISDFACWDVEGPFNTGDKYKLTFYGKGNTPLYVYFYGDNNYLQIANTETEQGSTQGSAGTDGRVTYNLTNEWIKYTVTWTLGDTGDKNVTKKVLFRVGSGGNTASVYGVRFEKLENEEHADKAVVKNLTSEPNGEVTLYAVWTPHEVTLPTATREGYIFNGWYDAKTGGNKIGNAGDKYIPEANTELHAQWRQVHYTVSVGGETLPAETLAEAVDIAEKRITGSVTTATITPTMSYADSSTATISKNITIDTKGCNITMANTITVAANATATFVDTATTKGKIQRTTGGIITNNGTVNIGNNSTNGAIVESTNIVINGGTVNVSSGIVNNSETTVNSSARAIAAHKINVSGGTVSCSVGHSMSGSIITITGGTITSRSGIAVGTGQLNISGGTVSGTNQAIYYNGGQSPTINISGGTVSGDNCGIGGDINPNNSTGIANITITGGTVTGAIDGIKADCQNTTLTIGDTSNALDRTTPVITGTSGYSVNMTGATSTFNFYDGKLVGGKKALKSESKRTIYGREMSFNIGSGVTFNPYPGHKPYTRTNDGKFETVLEKQVQVTFDKNANDAVLAEADRTKNVLTNVEYKEKAEDASLVEIPTQTNGKVTRTGYTFKGWRGKNLLNLQVPESTPSDTTSANTTNRTFTPNTWVQGLAGNNYFDATRASNVNISSNNLSFQAVAGYGVGLPLLAEPGKTYTASYNVVSDELAGFYSYASFYKEDGTLISFVQNSIVKNGYANIHFTTPNETKYLVIGFTEMSNQAGVQNPTVTISNLMLEEGTVATPYEPYYIVDETKVAREDNHTLYADWEANPYTVTADANGGSITAVNGWTGNVGDTTATKSVTFDTAYGTLPEVSRTGYTLAGWNGKNLFNKNMTPYLENKWIRTNGQFKNEDTYSVYKIDIKGDQDYTITTSGEVVNPAFVIYDENDNILYGQNYDKNKTITFTSPATTKYMLISVVTDPTFEPYYDKDIFQIEEGSTATSYEPYKTITAESLLATDCDHVIHAQWTPNPYTVTAHANGGSIAATTGWTGTGNTATKSVTYDSSYGTLPGVSKTGYTLAGWNTAENGSGTAVTDATIMQTASAHDIYAQWTANDYTVTLNNQGATTPGTESVTATYDSVMPNITAPEKRGHTFEGYYSNADAFDLRTSINPLTSTSKRINLAYPENNWTMTVNGDKNKHIQGKIVVTDSNLTTEPYYVEFDDVKIDPKSIIRDGDDWIIYVDFDITEEMFKNETYATVHRFIDLNGLTESSVVTVDYITKDGKKYYNADGEGVFPYDIADDATLYAHWSANPYTLTIDPAGGTWNGQTTATQVTQNYGTTYNVANNATKEGYVFGGWQLTKADGTQQLLTPEQGNEFLTSDIGSVKYFDESNKIRQYIIDGLDAEKPNVYGGSVVTFENIADSTSSTGYSMKITTNGRFSTGAGGFWHYTGSNAGRIYFHKIVAKIPIGYTINIASNQTGIGMKYYWLTDNNGTGDWKTYIYAQYTGYNAPFNALGHAYISGSDNTNVTWYLQESTMYQVGANLADLQTKNDVFKFTDSNVTMKAIWSESGSQLTFDRQGGTFGNGTIGNNWTETIVRVRYDKAYTTAIVPYYNSDSNFAIYKTGFTLDGWYTEPNGQGTKLFGADGILIPSVPGYSDANRKWLYYTNSFTIYANWIPNEYTIHFNNNGGTGTMIDQNFTYDVSQALTTNTFSRTGYTFAGWSQANEGVGNTLVYTSDDEMRPGQNAWGNADSEFSQYADFAPFFDRYGTNAKYRLEYDIKSTNTTNSNVIKVYFQNGGSSRYGLVPNSDPVNNVSVGNLHHVTVSSTEWTHDAFDFEVLRTESNVAQAMLAFFGGSYGNGNKPIVKNVRLYVIPNYTDEQEVSNLTTENNGTVNLYAVWTANDYTVTADANGGSVDSADGWDTTGAQPTKSVKYDSAYGTLPTVSRTGYTFKGWNGKNLFNPDTMSISATTHTQGTEEITLNAGVYDRILGKDKWVPKTNTDYTMVIEVLENTYSHGIRLMTDERFYIKNYDGDEVINAGTTGTHVITFKTREDFTDVRLGSLWFYSANTVTGTCRIKIAIYEGTEETRYESYYLSATTPVTTAGNHDITAVWEAIPYTLTADANGGTITSADGWTIASGSGSATKTVYYEDFYGSLPTAERSGYAFLGWYKENTFVNRVDSNTQVQTATDQTIYAKWLRFALNKDTIYLGPGASTTISPEGTTGAIITYTGENIGELQFESENTSVATVGETTGTIVTSVGATDGATTNIIIKDKTSGIKIGEITVVIDITPPDWLTDIIRITRRD